MFGSASDNERVYVSNSNSYHEQLNLTYLQAVPNAPGATSPPSNANGGFAAALDAFDGNILWSFTNPEPDWTEPNGSYGFPVAYNPTSPYVNANSLGPVTVANGASVDWCSLGRRPFDRQP